MIAARSGLGRRCSHAITLLLCLINGVDASAGQSSDQTLKQQAYAAYRARSIAAGLARNEKVVADNFFEAGNLEQAAKLYLHALAAAPDAFYYDEKKLIATRLASANHKPDAIAILEELLTERKNDLPEKLEIIKLLDTLQQHAVTLMEIDALLKQDSLNPYALLIKANSLRQQKRFRESVPLYRRILQQGSNFDARMGLIYSLLALEEKAEALREYKRIHTENDAQSEQYRELGSLVESSMRPSVDLALSHYADTDKNRSVEHSAVIRVVVGNLDWVANISDKTATLFDASANVKTYAISASGNATDRFRLTGKYGRAHLIADARRIVNTGQLKVDVNTGSGTLSGNVSWDALNATTASIQNAIQASKKSVELMQPFTERLKANLAYAYKSYSDGNAANDFRASASYVLYNGVPQISVGYGHHCTNYKNPLITGSSIPPSYSYSAPKKLVAHQAMLTSYYESEQFYINVDIEMGREAYEKNRVKIKDKFHYNAASIGFKATSKLSVELSAENSKAATAEIEDTYNDSIFGARVSYLL